MDPISLISGGITILLTQSPKFIELGKEVSAFFKSLAAHGVITAEEQNRLDAHVNQVCADRLAGARPPGYLVDPDPPFVPPLV